MFGIATDKDHVLDKFFCIFGSHGNDATAAAREALATTAVDNKAVVKFIFFFWNWLRLDWTNMKRQTSSAHD